MRQKGTPIRATLYIQAEEAEKVRAYARQANVSERRALRFLITAGLSHLADKEAISERLARFHRESHIRNRELLAMLAEVVLGVRLLVEHIRPGAENQLREWSKEAMALLNSKIERNEREAAE